MNHEHNAKMDALMRTVQEVPDVVDDSSVQLDTEQPPKSTDTTAATAASPVTRSPTLVSDTLLAPDIATTPDGTLALAPAPNNMPDNTFAPTPDYAPAPNDLLAPTPARVPRLNAQQVQSLRSEKKVGPAAHGDSLSRPKAPAGPSLLLAASITADALGDEVVEKAGKKKSKGPKATSDVAQEDTPGAAPKDTKDPKVRKARFTPARADTVEAKYVAGYCACILIRVV